MCPQITAEEWLNHGNAAYRNKEYATARDAYTQAINLDPYDPKLYNNRGSTHIELGNYEAAMKDYNHAIELNPQDADPYYGQGVVQGALGNHVEAIKEYTKALALNPEHINAYYNRGLMHYDLKQYEEAIKNFTQVLTLDPRNAEAYTNRGNTYSDLGNPQAAIKDYFLALKFNPEDSETYFNRGLVYSELEQYEEAIKDFTNALKFNSQYPDAYLIYHDRGYAHAALGRPQVGIEDYTQALKLNSQYILAYLNRCNAQAELSQYQFALSDANKAAQLDPKNSLAWLDQSWVTLCQSQPTTVVNVLKKGLTLATTSYEKGWGQSIQAALYLAEGEFTQAESNIKSAGQLITHKDDIWPILNAIAAEVYLTQGKAKDALMAAQTITPIPWRWLHALAGIAQLQLGLKDAALASLQEAVKAPHFPYGEKGYAWQARLHIQLGKLQTAQSDIEKALSINPQDVFIYVVRAELKEAQDDKRAALADYEKYLKIYPDHSVIQKRYQALKQAEKLKTTLTQLPFSFHIAYEDLSFGSKLGQGGFGVVYQGTYRESSVAIKTLLLAQPTEKTLQAFRKEIKIMANLRAPNIVQFYGVCDEPNHYCIVMEYMAKGSLYHLLHSTEALDSTRTLQIAKDITRGLAFLHAIPLVHCDLKSMNVLLDAHYNAKLCDFGLSEIKTETSTTSSNHSVGGTIAWMAPELFKRKAVSTIQSDMYSYSLVLWELTARKLPFAEAKGKLELIKEWVKDGEREEIPPNTLPKLARLITWGWKANPADRPTAKEALAVLEAPDEPVSDYLGNFVSAQM